MRAVIDTNVLMSGLLWRGTPHALQEQVRNSTLALISSPALLAEKRGQARIKRIKDDAVLALAIAAQADLVISGDDDLLCLASFEGIPILTPAQALQRVLESL